MRVPHFCILHQLTQVGFNISLEAIGLRGQSYSPSMLVCNNRLKSHPSQRGQQPTAESRPVLLAKASTCPKLLLLPAWESADDLAKGKDASIEYGGGFGMCRRVADGACGNNEHVRTCI